MLVIHHQNPVKGQEVHIRNLLRDGSFRINFYIDASVICVILLDIICPVHPESAVLQTEIRNGLPDNVPEPSETYECHKHGQEHGQQKIKDAQKQSVQKRLSSFVPSENRIAFKIIDCMYQFCKNIQCLILPAFLP